MNLLTVGSGGGGGSSSTWGEATAALGPSISGSTVFSIVLSFLLGALIVLTIFWLGKRAGHLETNSKPLPPLSPKTLRKYQDLD